MSSTAAFVLSVACVALMGYAVQRGATCTVAAVDELISRRSLRRLAAMVEASLWVAGGLVVAHLLGALPAMPPAFAVSGWTVAGGVLLGLGAWLNGACVFGAIARLGSGEWAYAATPLGYFAGCLTVQALFHPGSAQRLADVSPLFAAPLLAAAGLAVFAAWRLGRAVQSRAALRWHQRIWSPHAATTVIGITFFITLMVSGPWAYTELLADLAMGRPVDVTVRLVLFAALLGGAAWGGWTAGRWQATTPTVRQLARCLAGGALMGWGTLLIPGSNDGLILVGMPLLHAHAWVGFGTMCATIATAQLLRSSALARPTDRPRAVP